MFFLNQEVVQPDYSGRFGRVVSINGPADLKGRNTIIVVFRAGTGVNPAQSDSAELFSSDGHEPEVWGSFDPSRRIYPIQKEKKHGSVPYWGVSQVGKKYGAQICFPREPDEFTAKVKQLGFFETAIEAAHAYNKAVEIAAKEFPEKPWKYNYNLPDSV